MPNDITDTGFFEFETTEKGYFYSNKRKPGMVSFSRVFESIEAHHTNQIRFVTFGLSRMDTSYRVAALADEITLAEETAGRTEIRLILTEDGNPCEFVIQQFDLSKDAYMKSGVSLQSADVDRLLVAILTHRHYRRTRFASKGASETILLDELLERLEPVALRQALEACEQKLSAKRDDAT